MEELLVIAGIALFWWLVLALWALGVLKLTNTWLAKANSATEGRTVAVAGVVAAALPLAFIISELYAQRGRGHFYLHWWLFPTLVVTQSWPTLIGLSKSLLILKRPFARQES